jgi:hypothetical protein
MSHGVAEEEEMARQGCRVAGAGQQVFNEKQLI